MSNIEYYGIFIPKDFFEEYRYKSILNYVKNVKEEIKFIYFEDKKQGGCYILIKEAIFINDLYESKIDRILWLNKMEKSNLLQDLFRRHHITKFDIPLKSHSFGYIVKIENLCENK